MSLKNVFIGIGAILFFCQSVLFSYPALPNSYDMANAARKIEKGVVLIEVIRSMENPMRQGPPQETKSYMNGIVIDRKGNILTGSIPDDAKQIKVLWSQSEEDIAKLSGKDDKKNISIIKVDTKKELFPVNLGNSDNAETGEWVIFFGATGENYMYKKYFTYGMIAGKMPKNYFEEMLVSISNISPLQGVSGTVVANFSGDIIALSLSARPAAAANTRMPMQRMPQSGGSTSYICINEIKKSIEDLTKESKVEYGWIGINAYPLTKAYREYFSIPKTGMMIKTVFKNSPADKSGVKENDIISEIDGKGFPEYEEQLASDYSRKTALLKVGDTINFRILRGKEDKNISIKIEAEQKPKENKNEKMGLTVKEITDAVYYGSNLTDNKGVYVVNTERGGPAENAGIRPGDNIVNIEDMKIGNFKDYEKAMDSIKEKKTENIMIEVNRGRTVQTVILRTDVGAERK